MRSDRRDQRLRRRVGQRLGIPAVLGTALALAGGCGRPPQIQEPHRELVLALATATSAQNVEWLEGCARDIEAARSAGTLTEPEDRAFTAILDQARAGRWETARDRAYALRDAQRPTRERIEAVRQRTLPEPRMPSPRG